MTPAHFVKNCLVLELQRATPRHIEDQHAPAPGLGMHKATEQRQTQKGHSSQGQDGTFAELLGNHTSASRYPWQILTVMATTYAEIAWTWGYSWLVIKKHWKPCGYGGEGGSPTRWQMGSCTSIGPALLILCSNVRWKEPSKDQSAQNRPQLRKRRWQKIGSWSPNCKSGYHLPIKPGNGKLVNYPCTSDLTIWKFRHIKDWDVPLGEQRNFQQPSCATQAPNPKDNTLANADDIAPGTTWPKKRHQHPENNLGF